jgi:hypothetical protein
VKDTDKPKIEELTDELAFWNTFREIRRAKGLDIDRLYADWAGELAQGLTSPGAREDFAELCKAGCVVLPSNLDSQGLRI